MPISHTRTASPRRVLASLPLALLLLVLMQPSRAHAAASPDPVLRAIDAALVAEQVTAIQARDLRITWTASARAARTARTPTRRANITAVRAYTSALARSGGLTPPRVEPALLSVRATTWAMLSRDAFPSHEEELQMPDEVAVFTYYSGRGVQLQPFESFKQGLRELNQLTPDVEAARAIADRMLELDVPRGSSTTWEYYFPFGGPSRPWTSAISQAIATEFYWRVATLVPEAERAPYDDAAARANRAFLRSPAAGGVSVAEGDGRFYVMYPFAPSQRILNGHLQVLLNTNRYAKGTGSTEAAQVVELGTRAALALLPRFDTGAWSNYQPRQEAELSYHEFQTEQLQKLAEETETPVFGEYADRFVTYLETPPVLTLPDTAVQIPSIIPARDGFRDRAIVQFSVDKRARVTMVLTDAAGTEVRRMSWWGGRGNGQIIWDGRANDGSVPPDGAYRATFTSTDVVGNRARTEWTTPLRIERDLIAPAMGLLTMRERGEVVLVTASVSDAGSAWIQGTVRIDGERVATARTGRAGTLYLRIRRPIADVRRAELQLRDSSGNTYTYRLAG